MLSSWVWENMATVIVVDDDVDIVYSMSELLEICGIDVVRKGYNGLEGSKLFDQLRPDVVLLNLMMSKYDGKCALKKLEKLILKVSF